jgi:oligoribonuclease NrnB/cAMP/cGMP phosphodiesterase (DHH superfamily)
MKCFYHNDPDGKAAAWVVRQYATISGLFHGIPIDYAMPFPFEIIAKGEPVVIVDYSISPDEMRRLLDITANVLWIDHHKTAIDKYKDFPFEIAGIRRDGTAGCCLAWEYFRPERDLPVPDALRLIGDYDTWKHAFAPDDYEFYFGAGLHDLSPDGSFWDRAVASPAFVKAVLTDGHVVMQYRAQFYADVLKDIGYETDFEGHRMLCMNTPRVGSTAFGEKFRQYDACIAYFHDGRKFTVSLYSEKIDVAEICKRHGGGGHKGASGFQCEALPFKKV